MCLIICQSACQNDCINLSLKNGSHCSYLLGYLIAAAFNDMCCSGISIPCAPGCLLKTVGAQVCHHTSLAGQHRINLFMRVSAAEA